MRTASIRSSNAASADPVRVLEGDTSWVNGVCPIQVGQRQLLASASNDRTVRLWDSELGRVRATISASGWVRCVVSCAPSHLMLGMDDGLLAVQVELLHPSNSQDLWMKIF